MLCRIAFALAIAAILRLAAGCPALAQDRDSGLDDIMGELTGALSLTEGQSPRVRDALESYRVESASWEALKEQQKAETSKKG